MPNNVLVKKPSAVSSVWAAVQNKLDSFAAIANLVARLYIAKIFFYSGLSKFQDWESTLYLFREEYQEMDGPQKGEAKRDDVNYAYVAAWEWLGEAGKAELHKEALEFNEVKLTQRSYK